MKRILIIGMSGTGKSTVITELARRGYRAIDTDYDGYSHLVAADPSEVTGPGAGQDWVWREERIEALLSSEDGEVLFVAGCSPNQGKFYDRFDCIVLLTAPAVTIAERLAARTTNRFGKDPGELHRTLQLIESIEPHLRRRASVEIDTRQPVEDVVAAIVDLASG